MLEVVGGRVVVVVEVEVDGGTVVQVDTTNNAGVGVCVWLLSLSDRG